MSHANAALTPRARLRLARLIVEDGWTPSAAAKMFMVSTVTARKWAAATGPKGRRDARPVQPAAFEPEPDPRAGETQIVRLRWRRRLGPVQIGGELGIAALNRSRGAGALPDQPAEPHRPGHR